MTAAGAAKKAVTVRLDHGKRVKIAWNPAPFRFQFEAGALDNDVRAADLMQEYETKFDCRCRRSDWTHFGSWGGAR